MDRKGIIGITVAIITLVVWQIYYSREMQRYQEAQRAAAALAPAPAPADGSNISSAPPAGASAPGAAPGAVATPVVPPTQTPAPAEVKVEKLATPAAEYSFTTRGGGISEIVLLKHVAEYGKVEGDETKVTMNHVGPVPIGAVTEKGSGGTDQSYKVTPNATANEVLLEHTDARQIQTLKKFTLPKGTGPGEEYVTTLDLTFTNGSAQPVSLPGYFVHTGAAAPIHKNDQPFYTGVSYRHAGDHTFKDVNSFSEGGVMGFGKTDQPTFNQSIGNLEWVGVTNQYFTTIVTPVGVQGSAIWAHKFWAENATVVGAPGGKSSVNGVEGAIGMPGFTLAPGQSVTQKFAIYSGPREHRRLQALGGGQEEIMNFGIFSLVSKTLLWGMNVLNSKLGTYAAAIIVLTIIIKLLLWPLQNKATNSMKKMQALQPKMTELREKFKDDPQRMNTELMKLYKDYGVNPFGGCLPMLIQIPIFFGFYNMLGTAVELRNSSFLWVRDLSQPDTVAMLAGVPVNILPLVMAGTMFWQMAISPKSGDPVQQRVFMFMPLIFVFFCYNFASALALYWTVQNLFSVAQLYATRNQETPALQKVIAPGKKKR